MPDILSLPLCSISLGLLCTCPDDIYPFTPSSSCDSSVVSPVLVLPKPMDEGETAKNNKDKIIQNKLEMKYIISLQFSGKYISGMPLQIPVLPVISENWCITHLHKITGFPAFVTTFLMRNLILYFIN